ncbi:hypothetical protein, variant 1 [Fonticula alba]|uniref:GDT1 family protein n=1 Tax=Fonticula alba TaxID=691883 RepID=A0A058ZBG1_FONAL|nr:hypothetical protein, variant 1 [Fonticula alba]KCV71258.1 hypothetical protein, variant 1 [Fonticula alba]|eukprot:XP_009494380.1 hypothetical protein, variant 1 [Fonticula alba]
MAMMRRPTARLLGLLALALVLLGETGRAEVAAAPAEPLLGPRSDAELLLHRRSLSAAGSGAARPREFSFTLRDVLIEMAPEHRSSEGDLSSESGPLPLPRDRFVVGVLPGTRQKLSAPVLTPRGAAPTPGQADSDPGHWYWRADSSAPRYPVYSQTQGGPGDVGSPPASPVGFKRALLAGVAMTLASEIGDKTFFLAAILAMKLPRLHIWLGAWGALAFMTVLSCALGVAAPVLFPPWLVTWSAIALFLVCGVRGILEWRTMEEDASEELAEVEAEVKAHFKQDAEGPGSESSSTGPASMASAPSKAQVLDPELGLPADDAKGVAHAATSSTPAEVSSAARSVVRSLRACVAGVQQVLRPVTSLIPVAVLNTFMMVVVAEWGDRSQITTMALAAAQNIYGVTIGSLLGHAMCTGIAVVGGRLLAERVSIKAVTLIGSVLFIMFGLFGAFRAVVPGAA